MPKRSAPSGLQLPHSAEMQLSLSRRDSSDGDTRATKRARASRPKVKSGCITCKTRRVKCDETKPQCLRCLRFGRNCDGYPEPPSGRGVAMIPLKPRIPSITDYSPSISVHTTVEEHLYFKVFRERSVYELSGFFPDEFWTNVVLQASHATSPIRHAAIALGALNMSLEAAPGPQLKVNVIQSVDKKHHENAVLHYLKAIQALNQYLSTSGSPQLRVALISCLLFICFETFQGSFASSIQQTYGGLKILRSYYMGKPGSKPWIPQRKIQDSAATNSSTINKALQIRLGCDNVSKERAMTDHLEEYLEIENRPQIDPEDSVIGKVRTPSVQMPEPFVYDPRVEHVGIPRTMTGTDLTKEQQQNIMSVPVEERSAYFLDVEQPIQHNRVEPVSSRASQRSSLSLADSSGDVTGQIQPVRKSSYSLSESGVSTPTAFTPPSKAQLASPNEITNQQASASRKRPLASRSPTPTILQNDFTIEETIIQTFVRLDGHGLFFGMIPGIPPLIWDIHKTHHIPIPTSFSDFASAQRCWDFLMDRALQFFRRTLFNRAYSPSNNESPAQVARQQASYNKQLSEFDKAFRPIAANAIALNGAVLNPAALIITLYQKITVITLAAIRTDSEMVYDSYLSDFQYIVKTCAILMRSQNETQLPRNTRYSFEVGVIPPLHVTLTKCRDPIVRREAIHLLFQHPRQEGMWDGVLTARIGKWLTSCEEDGLPPPPLESRESSLCPSPSEDCTTQDRLSYPSPPHIADDLPSHGAWDNGTNISQSVVDGVISGALTEYASKYDVGEVVNSVGIRPRGAFPQRRASVGKGKGRDNQEKGWIIPEENRVQLMVVDFHIPDRYIKVKCQKALLREDGSREERETVIAW